MFSKIFSFFSHLKKEKDRTPSNKIPTNESHFIPFRQNMTELTTAIENMHGNGEPIYGTYTKNIEKLKIKLPTTENELINLFTSKTFEVKTYADYFRQHCRYLYAKASVFHNELPRNKNMFRIASSSNIGMFQEIFSDNFLGDIDFYEKYGFITSTYNDIDLAKTFFTKNIILNNYFFILDNKQNKFVSEGAIKMKNKNHPAPAIGNEYDLYIYEGTVFFKQLTKLY